MHGTMYESMLVRYCIPYNLGLQQSIYLIIVRIFVVKLKFGICLLLSYVVQVL